MNVISTGELTTISRNGAFVSSDLLDVNTDGSLGAFRWDASNGWIPTAHTGSCDTESTVNFSVDNHGSVYGLTYNSCTDYKAWKWNPRSGSTVLASPGVGPDGAPANTRVNQASADGETLVGWMEDPVTGLWEGAVWNSGVPAIVRAASGDPVDEVTAVSGNGALIGGALLDGQLPLGDGYRRRARGGRMEYVAPLPGDAAPAQPVAMSWNGDVMSGFSGNPFLSFNPGPFLWTRQMGTANLDEFLRSQGTAMEQWYSLWEPIVMSDDGKTIGGWGIGFLGYAGWVLHIDRAFVCHRSAGADHGAGGGARTQSVDFPGEFDEHLRHGDTVGHCT